MRQWLLEHGFSLTTVQLAAGVFHVRISCILVLGRISFIVLLSAQLCCVTALKAMDRCSLDKNAILFITYKTCVHLVSSRWLFHAQIFNRNPHLQCCFSTAGDLGNGLQLLPEKQSLDGAWSTLGRDCGCFRLCELEGLLDRERHILPTCPQTVWCSCKLMRIQIALITAENLHHCYNLPSWQLRIWFPWSLFCLQNQLPWSPRQG